MSYTEIVDTTATPDGLTFRALIVQDDDAQEPEFCAGCPIVRIDSGWTGTTAEMTGYGQDEYSDGLPDDASDIVARFSESLGGKRGGIDAFERYLRIYHDGNLVEYGPNRGTDFTYVAYVTRELWEAWGNTGEVGKADMDEWIAYVEGDVYGVMVESKPTVEVENADDYYTDPYSGDVSYDGWTETDGTCWGYYGHEYAEETARNELGAEVVSHNSKGKAKTLFQL